MKLYEQWQQLAQMAQTPQQQQEFWDDYFAAETEVYKTILADTGVTYEGTLKEVADKFEMDPVVFCGFMDGINTSLKKEIDVEKLEADSPVKLDIDFEKLFYNMNDAKAKWLYTLEEWDGVLSQEKRDDITREWRKAGQATSEKTAGRNDPCPCGSGKKYKKCCGK
ncbi:MAG: SEC-C metal-binding domain-containing protein [Christensenella sp.]|uniref:SEC-C metal-binding domain-containing protein n=1 Tax=Christensenella sp. TaxID=1935934 RepID=UPI002B1F04E2|nr:SEC-C metal-binding domain-containing protein [Christensenella sp.]MEA5004227.1 SEC-C metal-binding domain-containing protein [Christensenella sp.]